MPIPLWFIYQIQFVGVHLEMVILFKNLFNFIKSNFIWSTKRNCCYQKLTRLFNVLLCLRKFERYRLDKMSIFVPERFRSRIVWPVYIQKWKKNIQIPHVSFLKQLHLYDEILWQILVLRYILPITHRLSITFTVLINSYDVKMKIIQHTFIVYNMANSSNLFRHELDKSMSVDPIWCLNLDTQEIPHFWQAPLYSKMSFFFSVCLLISER